MQFRSNQRIGSYQVARAASPIRTLSVFNLFIISLLLVTAWMSAETGIDRGANILYPAILILLGIINITSYWQYSHQLLTPLSIFSAVWLIAIPATAGPFPLMQAMTMVQWRMCLIFDWMFMLSSTIFYIPIKYLENQSKNVITYSRITIKFLALLVLVSAVSTTIDAVIHGGFIAFSDDVATVRYRESFPGYSLLRAIGNLGVVLFSFDKRYRKTPVFALSTLLMIAVNLSIGVRFSIFVLAVSLVSSMADEGISRKMAIRVAAIGIVGGIAAFSLISLIRDVSDSINEFYISTGLYHGSIEEVSSTELFRYLGYSQRLMEAYVQSGQAGITHGMYTLAPLLGLLQLPFNPPDLIMIYGYNATNTIGYLYRDFGELWPLAAFVWSSIINLIYRMNIQRRTVFSKYCSVVALTVLTLSFYTYIHSLSYWITYFPVVLFVGHLILGNRWRDSSSQETLKTIKDDI